MSQKPLSMEIRERLPRLLTSLVVVFVLYLVLNIAPGFVEGITMPGVNIGVDMVVRLTVMLMILIGSAQFMHDAISQHISCYIFNSSVGKLIKCSMEKHKKGEKMLNKNPEQTRSCTY